MSIKVQFFANTRNLVGKPEVDVEEVGLTQPTARDVLQAVAKAENKDLGAVLRGRTRPRGWRSGHPKRSPASLAGCSCG